MGLFREINDPEERITKSKTQLQERKRELRQANLNHERELEPSEHLALLEAFFRRRYKTSFSDINLMLGNDTCKSIYSHIISKAKSNQRHLIIFPMLGSYFNYLFARGVINELKQKGLGNNLRIITLKTIRSYDDLLNYTYDPKVYDYVSSQVKNVIRNGDFDSYSVVDYSSYGFTLDLIMDVMNSYKKSFGSSDFLNVREHQNITSGYGVQSPRSLYYKEKSSGKVVPISHINEASKRYLDEDSLIMYSSHFLSYSFNSPNMRIGDVREMLFYFGRAYSKLYGKK